MAVDPTIIAAIRAAVVSDPDNQELRLHLADLLCQSAMYEEALSESQKILAVNPAHMTALRYGRESAENLGKTELAAGYQRLMEALGWTSAQNLLSSIELPPLEEKSLDSPEDDDSTDFDDLITFDDMELFEDEPLEESLFDAPQLENVTLADVAGMESVKRRLELAFLAPMRNPELRKMFKKNLKGGLLLYGPPGCGKTHIARAMAGELQARFMTISLTDVLDMYVGQSEKNLHEIFASARRLAPVVIFIDEIDALGRKRSLTRDHAGRNTINQLLQELDGLDGTNEGVFVLAATNHPWDIDSALRRPGRFDRTVLVTPPDPPARESILRMNMADRPHEGVDFGWLAKNTDDFSGADLVHLADSASEMALEASILQGRPRPVGMGDFRTALKEIKPSIKAWLETAKKYAVFANESGQWDDLREYLKGRRMI